VRVLVLHSSTLAAVETRWCTVLRDRGCLRSDGSSHRFASFAPPSVLSTQHASLLKIPPWAL
jgi:hypothetical protein